MRNDHEPNFNTPKIERASGGFRPGENPAATYGKGASNIARFRNQRMQFATVPPRMTVTPATYAISKKPPGDPWRLFHCDHSMTGTRRRSLDAKTSGVAVKHKPLACHESNL